MIPTLAEHRHVHFVGIAGIGNSALARYLLAKGYRVSGSDRAPGEQGADLVGLGARVHAGHAAGNIAGADLIVTTAAADPTNPEIAAARAASIPVVKRAELLAAIMNPRHGIAVAGTHGKTTTSALIGYLLVEAGCDPTVLIGGMSADLGSNARLGGDRVVVEADEYDASFLHLRPEIAVITNVEPDHLDFYGTVERMREAFAAFAGAVTGTLVVCADDPVLPRLVAGAGARVVTYGIDAGELRAESIEETGGETRFRAIDGDRSLDVVTRLAGTHNVRNTLAAIAVTRVLGLADSQVEAALPHFSGVARRFQIKGEVGDVLVMDDYAHHPTEVATNLAALKARFGRTVRLVFQPHTYTRTKAFLAEFAQSFALADYVYLTDIYPARESDTLGISGQDLAEAARAAHPRVVYAETADRAVQALAEDAKPGDLVITMGAGDVDRVADRLLKELRQWTVTPFSRR